jgi:hypothetical protein
MHSSSNAGSEVILEGATFIRTLRFDLCFGTHVWV